MARLSAVCLIGILLLTGCGGSPEDPPTSTTPSPTATPTTPAPPELPEEAKADTEKGAIAFVRHYLALLNFASTTGDTDKLVGLGTPNCKSCTIWTTRIRKIYDSGGSIRGGAWQLGSLSTVGRSPALPGWTFLAYITFGKQTVVEGEPPTTKQFNGGQLHATIKVARQGDEWRLVSAERPK